MDITQFDADSHAESTQRVSQGRPPLPRLAAGTLTVTSKATIVLGCGNSGAVRVVTRSVELGTKHSLSIPVGRNLEVTEIADMFTATGLLDVVMADNATVSAVAKILAASKDPKQKRLAKIVLYLSKQPAINQCSVLTAALAAKFWTPGGTKHSHDLSMWGRAFGLNGTGRYSNVSELVVVACSGESPIVKLGNLRNSSSNVTSALLRGNRARVNAFDALSKHGDFWAAIEGSDPVLYRRGVLIGSTASITPIVRHDGARLTAAVSTPFKLRDGTEILVFSPTAQTLEVRKAVLHHMDFDTDSNRLRVTIGPVVTTGKNRAARGRSLASEQWESLCRPSNIGRELFAITAPYLGGGFRGGKGKTAGGGTQPTGRTGRDIPLDVALAAAAE